MPFLRWAAANKHTQGIGSLQVARVGGSVGEKKEEKGQEERVYARACGVQEECGCDVGFVKVGLHSQ